MRAPHQLPAILLQFLSLCRSSACHARAGHAVHAPRAPIPSRPRWCPPTSNARRRTASHGPPLAFGSCSSPSPTSQYLTVGTPDANGAPAKSTGSLKWKVNFGIPGPPHDTQSFFDVEHHRHPLHRQPPRHAAPRTRLGRATTPGELEGVSDPADHGPQQRGEPGRRPRRRNDDGLHAALLDVLQPRRQTPRSARVAPAPSTPAASTPASRRRASARSMRWRRRSSTTAAPTASARAPATTPSSPSRASSCPEEPAVACRPGRARGPQQLHHRGGRAEGIGDGLARLQGQRRLHLALHRGDQQVPRGQRARVALGDPAQCAHVRGLGEPDADV